MQGNLVKQQEALLVEGQNQIRLDIANLASGIYTMISVNSDGQSTSLRFVKM